MLIAMGPPFGAPESMSYSCYNQPEQLRAHRPADSMPPMQGVAQTDAPLALDSVCADGVSAHFHAPSSNNEKQNIWQCEGIEGEHAYRGPASHPSTPGQQPVEHHEEHEEAEGTQPPAIHDSNNTHMPTTYPELTNLHSAALQAALAASHQIYKSDFSEASLGARSEGLQLQLRAPRTTADDARAATFGASFSHLPLPELAARLAAAARDIPGTPGAAAAAAAAAVATAAAAGGEAVMLPTEALQAQQQVQQRQQMQPRSLGLLAQAPPSSSRSRQRSKANCGLLTTSAYKGAGGGRSAAASLNCLDTLLHCRQNPSASCKQQGIAYKCTHAYDSLIFLHSKQEEPSTLGQQFNTPCAS